MCVGAVQFAIYKSPFRLFQVVSCRSLKTGMMWHISHFLSFAIMIQFINFYHKLSFKM